MTTTKQTCADLVQGSWDSTRADLAAMYTSWDVEKIDLFQFLDRQGVEMDISDDLQGLVMEQTCDYGLSIDYVTSDRLRADPVTQEGQEDSYFRYQFSWGGPSTELRLYASDPSGPVYKAEYWHLDWFDGAMVDVTTDDVVQAVWDTWQELELPQSKMTEAYA